jgi:hypothetical protein
VRLLAVLLGITAVATLGASVDAAGADEIDPTTGTGTSAGTDSGGTVTSEAGTGDLVSGVVYTSGGSSGPKCSWDRYSNDEFERATGTPPREPPQYHDDPKVEVAQEELDRRGAELVHWQRNEDRRRSEPKVTYFGGEAHYVYAVRCIGFTGTVRLVPTTVATDDLIPGLHDVAKGRILVPVPDVSPELGTGYVNLGMWLAVKPAAIAPITAEAGPNVWITVTPEHQSIHFDFGNGDTRTCDGFGKPISYLETFDEGPCGYTYRHSSPDSQPYQVRVSTTWNLPYTSSNGSGTLPPFTRDAVFAHNVDELQTVGQSN